MYMQVIGCCQGCLEGFSSREVKGLDRTPAEFIRTLCESGPLARYLKQASGPPHYECLQRVLDLEQFANRRRIVEDVDRSAGRIQQL
jgi:hypothetical protein